MALSIASDYFTSAPAVVPDDVREIRLITDQTKISVDLSVDGVKIYSSVLYASNGSVRVSGVDGLVMDFMRERSLSQAKLKIFAEELVSLSNTSVSKTVNLIFCSYALPKDFNIFHSFLSCIDPQRVTPKDIFNVHLFCAEGNPVTFRVSGISASGSPVSATIEDSAHDGYISVNMPDIIESAKSFVNIDKVSVVSLVYGSMSKAFFVVRPRNFLEFRFLNCFNVKEPLIVSGQSVMVSEVDREFAVCSGVRVPYDVRVSRSYEHVTGPLTRLEAAGFSQLVEAESAAVVIDDREYPIIITDHESKVSDDDASLNVLKFTWRFAEERPRLFGSSLSPLLPASGIFTDQFTEPFE